VLLNRCERVGQNGQSRIDNEAFGQSHAAEWQADLLFNPAV